MSLDFPQPRAVHGDNVVLSNPMAHLYRHPYIDAEYLRMIPRPMVTGRDFLHGLALDLPRSPYIRKAGDRNFLMAQVDEAGRKNDPTFEDIYAPVVLPLSFFLERNLVGGIKGVQARFF